MTNGEWIRQMDDYDLAAFLCKLVSSDGCYGVQNPCPAAKKCYRGHNGMADYLKAKHVEDEK